MSKMAIVAIQTNLVGRNVTPVAPADDLTSNHLWPFRGPDEVRDDGGRRMTYSDTEAEIVGAFVGDLQDGGEVKFLLKGHTTGRLKTCYSHSFIVR